MLLAWIIFSLILSALFSGSEIAFVSANKLRIELKKKKGATRGNVIAGFYEQPAHFLGTMLVGNNIALVVFTTLTKHPLDIFFSTTLGISSQFILLLINTIFLTVVVLIFGEFLPKTLFRLYANNVLYMLAYPLRLLQFLLTIPAWLMTKVSNLLLRLVFKTQAEEVETVFTRLDLENFINDSTTHSEEEIDKELFGKALNLKEVRIRDCMVPRTEIENIDVSASVEELIKLFEETKLSRIIITQGDIDNVLGYIHHQQLLSQPKDISGLVLNIPFVPEVMYVTDLMNKFIKSKGSIACVVDEFGGVSGIITLEDILEEIFGEIEDEYDQEEYVEREISDTEFLFSGRLEITYLNEKYPNLFFPEGDYQTLSGYLVMTIETIPEQGAEIELEGYKFVLELVSNTKIETVRVIKLAK
ncbi:MAG: hemolysin [Saprospiraceae bacterium]|nr:MAG: hemolysin [Saprospiraceae bacterium]